MNSGNKNKEAPKDRMPKTQASKEDQAAPDGMACLMSFASKHTGSYLASIVLAVIGVAGAITPYFAAANMVVAVLEGDKQFQTYLLWTSIAAAGFLIKIGCHNLSTALSHKVTFSVLTDVRSALASKLQRTPLGYVLRTPSGKLKNTMVEKVDSIEPTLAHVVPEMTSNLLVPLAIVVYLFTIDWRMALVSLVVLPIGFLCLAGMMKDYEAKFGVYVAANKHMNATAVEYVNGIEVIKAFGQSASSYRKFSDAVHDAAYSALNWMKGVQIYSDMAYAIWPATLVSVLPVGCIFVMDGSLAPAEFIVIIMLALGIAQPLYQAMSYIDDIAKIGTIMNDVAVVLEAPEQERPEQRASLNGHAINLSKVSFSYEDTEILHDINLSIDEGSYTAFVGPSGSGKSTIAKLIAGYWDVDSGVIELGGADTRAMPSTQLMEQIAYVSQDNYLFDLSILDNIRLGKHEASDEEVRAVAKSSGCHEFIMQLEDGYETQVGSAGGKLSGGERQRIAIARAMLKDAPIVILDEATAYTDPENEAVIQEAVARLVAGKTLIVIAHRLSTIKDADVIAVVENGSILAQGAHEQLLESCSLYKNMYEAHIEARDAA